MDGQVECNPDLEESLGLGNVIPAVPPTLQIDEVVRARVKHWEGNICDFLLSFYRDFLIRGNLAEGIQHENYVRGDVLSVRITEQLPPEDFPAIYNGEILGFDIGYATQWGIKLPKLFDEPYTTVARITDLAPKPPWGDIPFADPVYHLILLRHGLRGFASNRGEMGFTVGSLVDVSVVAHTRSSAQTSPGCYALCSIQGKFAVVNTNEVKSDAQQ